MKFEKLFINGVWLISPEILSDERGFFRRSFCSVEFNQHGLEPAVLQGNISVNPVRGTLRGFHYQIAPAAEAKTLTCVLGSLYDVVVDLRPNSETFLKWQAVELNSVDCQSLYIPKGCANGYLTTDENTVIHYYMSELYVPDLYRGFKYDDPKVAAAWPFEPVLISDKDRSYPDLDILALA